MNPTHRSWLRHAAWSMLLLLASWLPASAQLADRHAGHQHDHDHPDGLDELLNKYDQRIEFTENKGQFGKDVLYRADFPLGQAVATSKGMVVTTYDPVGLAEFRRQGILMEEQLKNSQPAITPVWNQKGHSWRLNFRGASPGMKVENRTAHTGVTNYFMGGVEAMDVRSFQEVWYTNTYPGVDVRYYPAEDGTLEYDIICKPGSDPKQIAIEFEGIERIAVNTKGELVLHTSLGEMTYPAPVVYQRTNGKERSVKAAYVVDAKNILRFELGDYDKGQPLVIDPIALRWATWMNTASQADNHGHCIWVDPADGAIYVVSRTSGGTDQITPGAFSTTIAGSYDMIVGKYMEPANVGGQGDRVWQTYIGGNGIDNPYAMEQGPDGHLYITGQTQSTNFPLLGGSAFSGSSVNQRSQSGYNVYVMKLNTAGNSIKSAVIGGDAEDTSYDLRIADNGDVFVAAATKSNNLATTNPGTGATNRSGRSDFDVLLFRINQDLSAVQWMKNYGGTADDLGQIMLYDDASGDIFMGGRTKSSGFPTVSPRQSTMGGTEAGFLQRISGSGSVIWSSFFQSASNQTLAILCMSMSTTGDEIYFGGITSGMHANNTSAAGTTYDNTYNSGTNDFFVARMRTDQTFLGSTYIGGSSNEVNMMGLNTDQNNDVYVFGYTNSNNFPVSSSPNTPVQPNTGGSNDKVFFKLSADLSSLIYSTYYGGNGDDYDPVGERGIKFSNCRIYTIITSLSNNIPLTQGALNTTKNSSQYEPGIVVWANPPDLLGNSITYNGTAICAGSVPGDITGSEPSYLLPTIVRNNSASAHPSFGAAATFQWQISADSIHWSNITGQTGRDLSGSAIGALSETRYIRRIIGGDACILAGAADQVVTVRIMSVQGQVTPVTCNGAANGTITATADGLAPFQYAWSNGQTTQTATNLAPGSHSVTVTDANGCTAQGTFQMTQPNVLNATSTVNAATCSQANGSATAHPTGGNSPYGYYWSNGSTGASISGVTGGTYSVRVTDAKGCEITIDVVIPSSGLPTVDAGAVGVITCATGAQITLSGSADAGMNYTWVASNGGQIVSGANTLTPVVSAAGTYTLTVTNPQSGCSANDATTVIVNTTAPNASITGGGTLTCSVTSFDLNGGSTTTGATFSWSGPNGFTSTDEDVTVNTAGTYVLTVTDPTNGCTRQASVQIGANVTAPGASAQGGTLNCNIASIQLSGSGNGTFAWTGPNGFASTAQNPTVNAAGTYTLVVTGANGCTSTAQATVILDDAAPGAQANGGTLNCNIASIQLSGSGNGTFAWSGPNGFSSTAQNPTVSVAGTYTLVVTGTNGCTSSAQATVILDDAAPGAQANGGVLNCNVSSIQLSGAGNGTFAWSGPNNFTSTEQNPTVSAAGIYTLVVTGANGCTSQASAEVTLDEAVPGAQANGGVLNCNVSSIALSGSGNGTFAWSGPNNFTSTEQNPTVSAAGIYTLV
ncbi:MAG: SBBP repeat-containing protein, partial [Flavobacteriales bacterium]|nr:SBBP repeat-containing protein [Flavobacteriales bacterium]